MRGRSELAVYAYGAWMLIALFLAAHIFHPWMYGVVENSFLNARSFANVSVLVFLIVANFAYLHLLDGLQNKAKEGERKWS